MAVVSFHFGCPQVMWDVGRQIKQTNALCAIVHVVYVEYGSGEHVIHNADVRILVYMKAWLLYQKSNYNYLSYYRGIVSLSSDVIQRKRECLWRCQLDERGEGESVSLPAIRS